MTCLTLVELIKPNDTRWDIIDGSYTYERITPAVK